MSDTGCWGWGHRICPFFIMSYLTMIKTRLQPKDFAWIGLFLQLSHDSLCIFFLCVTRHYMFQELVQPYIPMQASESATSQCEGIFSMISSSTHISWQGLGRPEKQVFPWSSEYETRSLDTARPSLPWGIVERTRQWHSDHSWPTDMTYVRTNSPNRLFSSTGRTINLGRKAFRTWLIVKIWAKYLACKSALLMDRYWLLKWNNVLKRKVTAYLIPGTVKLHSKIHIFYELSAKKTDILHL